MPQSLSNPALKDGACERPFGQAVSRRLWRDAGTSSDKIRLSEWDDDLLELVMQASPNPRSSVGYSGVMTRAQCSAPKEGHQGDTAAAAKCPVHGRGAVAVKSASAPVPTLGAPRIPEHIIERATLIVPSARHGAKQAPDRTILVKETHFLDGVKSRLDGPAETTFNEDGSIRAESWYSEGELHREDGPAIVVRFPGGETNAELWVTHGYAFNANGPSLRVFGWPDGDGNAPITLEKWLSGDEVPPDLGTKEFSLWSGRDAKQHREDGPSEITYNKDGSVASEKWHLHGEEVTERAVRAARTRSLGMPVGEDNNLAFERLAEVPLPEWSADIISEVLSAHPNG